MSHIRLEWSLTIGLALTACGGSLNASKPDMVLLGVPLQVEPTKRCQTLDTRHTYAGGTATGAALLASGVGLSSVPAKDELETGLLIASVVSAGVAAGASYIATESATTWARDAHGEVMTTWKPRGLGTRGERHMRRMRSDWTDAQRQKAALVMREYYRGDLRTSHGKPVANHRQAQAIAMSEARRIGEEAEVTLVGAAWGDWYILRPIDRWKKRPEIVYYPWLQKSGSIYHWFKSDGDALSYMAGQRSPDPEISFQLYVYRNSKWVKLFG